MNTKKSNWTNFWRFPFNPPGGSIFAPPVEQIQIAPEGRNLNFLNIVAFNIGLLRTFLLIFMSPLSIFFDIWFFSKWCQTKIEIFRDFLIYNDRIEKSNFSGEIYQNITKLDRNVQLDVIFKILIKFWKIGIFSWIHAIMQFLKFYHNFTVIHPDVGEL